MDLQSQNMMWGMAYAGVMYIIGNGVWVNHLARTKQRFGWLLWLISSVLILLIGAVIASRLTHPSSEIWAQLAGADPENYWIILTLFALMSVPGASSVIFKQDARWTRMALFIPAIAVFIPMGMQWGGGNNIVAGFGMGFAVCALLGVWQLALDPAPDALVKT